MSDIQKHYMQVLYGSDIWEGFDPQHFEETVQGWNGVHPALSRFAADAETKVVIDVGVWKGGSTIHMASAMKERNINGVVIAIDTFLGSPEHWAGRWAMFKRHHGMPDLYYTFMSNVVRAGVADYVIPMPQASVIAVQVLQRARITAGLIHVDAAHEYREVLRDVEDYWEILAPGGHMVGDDYSPSWPGVIKAAGEFSARVCLPLSIQPPKWILQKPA
jgi:hypothetical protein